MPLTNPDAAIHDTKVKHLYLKKYRFYICLIIASANPELLTQVAPSIKRSKS